MLVPKVNLNSDSYSTPTDYASRSQWVYDAFLFSFVANDMDNPYESCHSIRQKDFIVFFEGTNMSLNAVKASQLPVASSVSGTELVTIVQNGQTRTVLLSTLFSQGADGKSAYELDKEAGYGGTLQQWLESLKGTDGRSAFQLAQAAGFNGTEQQWRDSLKGTDGDDGKSAYQSAIETGAFTGTEIEWAAAQVAAANDVKQLKRERIVTVRATPGVDASDAVDSAVAALKLLGGGTLSMPVIGGVGYYVSRAILIDFSNVEIVLEDNLTYIGTNPLPLNVYGAAALVHFQGAINTGPQQNVHVYLDNVSLRAPKRVKIDGGASNHTTVTRFNLSVTTSVGSKVCTTTSTAQMFVGMRVSGNANIPALNSVSKITNATTFEIDKAATVGGATTTTFSTGYDHVVGYGSRHGVLFQFCKNVYLANIHADNCLAGGITGSYVIGGTLDNPVASNIRYDNGVMFYNNGEHYGAMSDTTTDTWCNVTINNARAYNCANHGVSTYGAIGVTWNSPKVWNCGNNTKTAPNGLDRAAGPAGGVGVEFDSNTDVNALLNYRTTINNPQVTGSYGFGIRTNARGTKVTGGFVRNTKVPTAYAADEPANPIWGYGVFVQNNGTLNATQLGIESSERGGLRMQGGTNQYPEAVFDGTIRDCVGRAIYGVGIGALTTSPASRFTNNGSQAGGATVVDLTNSALNASAGRATISGIFENNGGSVLSSASLGSLNLSQIQGKNNGANLASAFHAIYVSSGVEVTANTINLTSTNSKQARILKVDACDKAVIDRSSILGDQTRADLPRAEVSSTLLIGEVCTSADPTSAPSYLGQKFVNYATGDTWHAKGTSGVGDWVKQVTLKSNGRIDTSVLGDDVTLTTSNQRIPYATINIKATLVSGSATTITILDQNNAEIGTFILDTVGVVCPSEMLTSLAGQLRYRVDSGTGVVSVVASQNV